MRIPFLLFFAFTRGSTIYPLEEYRILGDQGKSLWLSSTLFYSYSLAPFRSFLSLSLPLSQYSIMRDEHLQEIADLKHRLSQEVKAKEAAQRLMEEFEITMERMLSKD